MNIRRIFSQIALVIGTLLFSVGIQAFAAFTQPTTAPPNADAYAPLNTGPDAQAKTGGLLLNTGGAANGLIVQNGNVGIGTTVPGEKFEVTGNIKLSGASPAYKIINLLTPTASADAATKGYVDAATASGKITGGCEVFNNFNEGTNSFTTITKYGNGCKSNANYRATCSSVQNTNYTCIPTSSIGNDAQYLYCLCVSN